MQFMKHIQAMSASGGVMEAIKCRRHQTEDRPNNNSGVAVAGCVSRMFVRVCKRSSSVIITVSLGY